MIINKQNLLEAGACVEGADEAAAICNFPCEYSVAIQRCKDADRNDLAAWMILFKPQIIETTPNWIKESFKAKNINDGQWQEVKTQPELVALVDKIKEDCLVAHKNLFVVNKEIKVGNSTRWELVDLDLEKEDAVFDIYDCLTGLNKAYKILAEAKLARKEIQQKFVAQLVVPQEMQVQSADKTESAWIAIK